MPRTQNRPGQHLQKKINQAMTRPYTVTYTQTQMQSYLLYLQRVLDTKLIDSDPNKFSASFAFRTVKHVIYDKFHRESNKYWTSFPRKKWTVKFTPLQATAIICAGIEMGTPADDLQRVIIKELITNLRRWNP